MEPATDLRPALGRRRRRPHPLIEIVRPAVAVRWGLAESATCTVKVKVPVVLGFPLTRPDLDSHVPVGSWPAITFQCSGPRPPSAVSRAR